MRALLLLALLSLAAPAFAQDAPVGEIPEGCTYSTCALRAEPAFLTGLEIVRGELGATVARPNFFGALDLRSAVAGSPSAMEHANRYHEARTRTLISIIAATGLAIDASYAIEQENSDLAIATYVGALGVSIYSSSQVLASQRELERALWDYNGEFAR